MTSLSELILADPDFYKGKGSFTFPNGDKYVGEYCAHRSGVVWREGVGQYTTADGHTYTGEWRDDLLVENTPVEVFYKDGVQFNGYIVRNKYDGPGIYIFENKMTLLCNFYNNQPEGEIVLIDAKGREWHGTAAQDEALLLPEHTYFNDINDNSGKGKRRHQSLRQRKRQSDVFEHSKSSLQGRKSRSKSIKSISYSKTLLLPRTRSTYMSETSSTMVKILQSKDQRKRSTKSIEQRKLSKNEDRYSLQEEMRIFAKTKKTASDLQFENSDWYKNYVDFKKVYDNIAEKISKGGRESLNDQENIWYEKYMKFKQKYSEIMTGRKNKRNKLSREKMFQLIETENYTSKCPPISVVYPTPDCGSVCDCELISN